MRATINGVDVEGTPEELASFAAASTVPEGEPSDPRAWFTADTQVEKIYDYICENPGLTALQISRHVLDRNDAGSAGSSGNTLWKRGLVDRTPDADGVYTYFPTDLVPFRRAKFVKKTNVRSTPPVRPRKPTRRDYTQEVEEVAPSEEDAREVLGWLRHNPASNFGSLQHGLTASVARQVTQMVESGRVAVKVIPNPMGEKSQILTIKVYSIPEEVGGLKEPDYQGTLLVEKVWELVEANPNITLLDIQSVFGKTCSSTVTGLYRKRKLLREKQRVGTKLMYCYRVSPNDERRIRKEKVRHGLLRDRLLIYIRENPGATYRDLTPRFGHESIQVLSVLTSEGHLRRGRIRNPFVVKRDRGTSTKTGLVVAFWAIKL